MFDHSFNRIAAAFAAAMIVSAFHPVEMNAGNPVMKGHDVWTVTSGVDHGGSDFSGLCFGPHGKKMLAIFNRPGLYWMDVPSSVDSPLVFSPILTVGHGLPCKRDMEGVAFHPRTSDIYFVQETETVFEGERIYVPNSLYCLKAPDYTVEERLYSFDEATVRPGNSGLEGLTRLRGRRFVIGVEGSRDGVKVKPALYFWSPRKGVYRHIDMSGKVRQVAEVCYDAQRKNLWIVDGDYDLRLYRCNMDGEILSSYDISFIHNAEGICVDHKRDCIWIASDDKPSKLYKIYFEDL